MQPERYSNERRGLIVPDRPPIRTIETAAQLENVIHEMTINNLRKLWGGRLPTWEEFKRANKDGCV